MCSIGLHVNVVFADRPALVCTVGIGATRAAYATGSYGVNSWTVYHVVVRA